MQKIFLLLLQMLPLCVYAQTDAGGLPITLKTREEAQAWRDISKYKTEADAKVNAAQAALNEKIKEFEQLKKESADASKKHTKEKQNLEATLTDDFAKRERSGALKRAAMIMVGLGTGAAITVHKINGARAEIAAVTRALHQDDLINWGHEIPLLAIKKMPEPELAKRLIASYFSSPGVITKASLVTPIERVLKAVNDRIAQVQIFLAWQQSSMVIRWLVGVDSRLQPVAQERLVRLILMRDALMNYNS